MYFRTSLDLISGLHVLKSSEICASPESSYLRGYDRQIVGRAQFFYYLDLFKVPRDTPFSCIHYNCILDRIFKVILFDFL